VKSFIFPERKQDLKEESKAKDQAGISWIIAQALLKILAVIQAVIDWIITQRIIA
jgi:hypothetical protein